MKLTTLEVISNRQLNPRTYELILSGDIPPVKSGQFADLAVKGWFLKRPFSIADCEGGRITVLYKAIGGGTREMAGWKKGDTTDALVCIGEGFDTSACLKPLLVGGGIGAAPLYLLAKEFNAMGITPDILLAFRDKEEAYYIDEFKALGNVYLSTDNGSLGYKGNALEALKYYNLEFDRYYACGTLPMLKAFAEYSRQGQLSLEARMGCGFGACMGCSIKTKGGPKRVCKEGPVFRADEVIF
jgi:dihydroorotate dehydrogenase electron transfer subunit